MKYFVVISLMAIMGFSQDQENAAISLFGHSQNISPEEATSITQRFEVELQKTESITLLERNELNKILAEQGFQESGACDETNCNVEIGKLAGVSYMFLGNVSKIEKNYSLSVKKISVETGVVVQSFVMDTQGGLEEVLTQSCEDVARQFAGLEPKNHAWYANKWLWTTGALVSASVITTYFLLQESPKAKVRDEEILVGSF